EEEARAYVDKWVKTTKRRDVVYEIPPQLMEAFGKNTARKIRGCVYDNIVKDRERFVQTVMEEGYPEDNKMWGINYALDCIPEKFTPEIEKAFIKLMNERGLPKSISQCIMKSIKKRIYDEINFCRYDCGQGIVCCHVYNVCYKMCCRIAFREVNLCST
ncbi:MAG: hypothetical protein IJ734_00315, partial [Fibrobacter sp.]|nr:hypothetical protein [Fibrobacter sp.]